LISDFPLKDREVLGIYLLLKERERELDEPMLKLLDRLERVLYRELTIDEFENIREKYTTKKN
jgi:hypothetical protein